MNLIYEDEITILYNLYLKKLSSKTYPIYFLFITDGNSVGKYCLSVFERLISKQKNISVFFLNTNINSTEDLETDVNIKRILSPEELMWNDIPIITTCILDLKKYIYTNPDIKSRIFMLIEHVIKKQCLNSNHRLIFSSILPNMPSWGENITHLSELELSVILRNCDESTPAYFLHRLENLISNVNIKNTFYCLRFDNVFGPQIEDTQNMDFSYYIQMARHQQSSIRIEDTREYYSCVYIRDILKFYLRCFFSEDQEKTYNFVSYNIQKTDLANTIYQLFPNRISELSFKRTLSSEQYHNLETLKLNQLRWKRSVSFKEAIYRTFCDKCEIEYEIERINNKYHGHLSIIQKLELDIVLEIDRICRENNINYFLAGGSLLGAVRHHGFIPWDDDLDIGMLREDFERFRKLCPQKLPPQFSYQSYRTDSSSHYIFDKIRLKNTYFATAFSKRFPIENGVFVDILVYDKTSNHPFVQKFHIRLIQIMKRAINVRWVNKPRKKLHYRATKILLPFMRLIPFRLYHILFEMLIQIFNKADTDFYIDSVGMNIIKGAFRKECILGETQRVPFENTLLPIPIGSDEYLRHWYGDSYMEVPSISSRTSGHNLVQIDVGEYIK